MTDKFSTPPKLAERLLEWLKAPDYIVGDFSEEFEMEVVQSGRFRACFWYWQQLLRSAPNLLQRRWQTAMKTLTKRDRLSLTFSILLLVPAMLAVIPGVLYSVFGVAGPMNAIFDTIDRYIWLSWLLHPVLILGGMLLALLLVLWPMVRFEVNNEQDRLVGSFTIRKGLWLHLLVVSTVVLFGLLIFIYMAAEELQIFA